MNWLRRLIDGPSVDCEAILRDLAERRAARGSVIPMDQHLASLPPNPPMFEPEWAGDPDRERRE